MQNMRYAERIKPLLDARVKKIKTKETLEELLAKLFDLKEEQRKIRLQIKTAERIHNALSISPCIIDYAINFGIVEVERKWRAHLVENGNLASPILF
jgi:hypothetical protein